MNDLYSILNIPINHDANKNTSGFTSYTDYSALSPLSIEEKSKVSLEKQAPSLTKKNVRFAAMNDSIVAYEAHPAIRTQKKEKDTDSDSDTESDDGMGQVEWPTSMQVYLGSITVVGLYALFRALQRSR